jgi:NAD(P)-dependent dehydrogenase (short-subunit alcohol dehydrogenase family)
MSQRKTVLITGASSGIGKASAALFADKGWNVVATMRKPAAESTAATLVTRLDVEDAASIPAAIAAGIARFGHIDLVVNNAGYGLTGLFESFSPEQVRQQFAVNVFGVMDVTRAILPHFREHKGGAFINVSSGAGLFTLPMASLYCASKFALEGFSEALSYELASLNIAVKLVIPHGGVTETSFLARNAAERENATTPHDYDAFVEKTMAVYGRMTAASSITSGDVAKVIFQAATDGTDRLRYLVGDDARGFVKAWETMRDEDYVAYMRGYFR